MQCYCIGSLTLFLSEGIAIVSVTNVCDNFLSEGYSTAFNKTDMDANAKANTNEYDVEPISV